MASGPPLTVSACDIGMIFTNRRTVRLFEDQLALLDCYESESSPLCTQAAFHLVASWPRNTVGRRWTQLQNTRVVAPSPQAAPENSAHGWRWQDCSWCLLVHLSGWCRGGGGSEVTLEDRGVEG